jgi:hypothetical protein
MGDTFASTEVQSENSKPSWAPNFKNLTDPRFFVRRSAGFSSLSMKYTTTNFC